MSFNYQSEKQKWWKKEKADIQIMKAAGMNETDIEELVRFDWQEFLTERRFQSHSLSLELMQDQGDLVEDTICRDYESQEITVHGAVTNYTQLLECIGNSDLYTFLFSMNPTNMQIVLLRFIQDLSIKEIAVLLSLTENAVWQRIKWLKKHLEKFLL